MEIADNHKVCIANPEYVPIGLLAGEGPQLGHIHHRILREHFLPVLHCDKLHICGILLPPAQVPLHLAHPHITVLLLPHNNSALYSYTWYLQVLIHHVFRTLH